MPYQKIQCTFCGGECEPLLPHSCSYTAGVRMVLPLDNKHLDIRVPVNETAVAVTCEQELVREIARLERRLSRMRRIQADALDCLSDLYAVQNGCPLPKYEADWTAAMRRAERLLGIEAGDQSIRLCG